MRKIVFFLVLLFLVVSLIRNSIEYKKSLSFYHETKKNLAAATEKNKRLLLQKTTSNSAFEIEKNLRNEENLLRDREIMVIVPSPTATPPPVRIPTPPAYRQWLTVFFQ